MVVAGVGSMRGDLGSQGPCVGMKVGPRQVPLPPHWAWSPPSPLLCECALGEHLARIVTY